MSTNYYFQVYAGLRTYEDVNTDLQEYLLSQVDNELHIGKSSFGRRPIFQKTDLYGSVKEIKDFYDKNKEHLTIVDEYDTLLSWRDLESKLINWNKDSEKIIDRKEELGFMYKEYQYYKDEEGYDFSVLEFS